MDVDNQTPIFTVHGFAKFCRLFFTKFPLLGQLLRPTGQPRAQGQHPHTVLTRSQYAGWCGRGCDRNGKATLRIRCKMQARFFEFKPVGLEGDGFFTLKQSHDCTK